MVHQVWPQEPGRTRILCDWLFHPEAAGVAGYQPEDAIEFLTGRVRTPSGRAFPPLGIVNICAGWVRNRLEETSFSTPPDCGEISA